MRRHSVNANAYADGLTQEVARGFRLIFEFQHFEMGGGAARQFSVNAPTRSPSNAAPTGAITESWVLLSVILAGVPASARVSSPSLKLRNLTRLFMVTTSFGISVANNICARSSSGVERVGNRQEIRHTQAVPEDDRSFGVKVVNDNSGSDIS